MLEPQNAFPRFIRPGDFMTPRRIKLRERLQAAVGSDNVRPAPSMQSDVRAFRLCHQKFAVVDRKRLLLESGNWDFRLPSNQELPAADGSNWSRIRPAARDWAVLVENADVATYFAEKVFEADWNLAPGRDLTEAAPAETGSVQTFVTGPSMPTRLFGPPLKPFQVPGANVLAATSPQLYYQVASDLIDRAQHSLAIQQFYISAGARRPGQSGARGGAASDSPQPGSSDAESDRAVASVNRVQDLLDAIVRAHRRGVHVRIMLDPNATLAQDAGSLSHRAAVQWLYDQGLQASIRFRSTGNSQKSGVSGPPHLPFLHNKGIIADGQRVLVTSTNWSAPSVFRNREAGLLFDHAGVARYFQAVYDLDWNEAAFALPNLADADTHRLVDSSVGGDRDLQGADETMDETFLAATYTIRWTQDDAELD